MTENLFKSHVRRDNDSRCRYEGLGPSLSDCRAKKPSRIIVEARQSTARVVWPWHCDGEGHSCHSVGRTVSALQSLTAVARFSANRLRDLQFDASTAQVERPKSGHTIPNGCRPLL